VIEQFHFLRPEWFLALVILGLVLWILRHQRHDSGNWRSVIDARLLPYVLSDEEAGGDKRLSWILIFVLTMAIIALAGPTWESDSNRFISRVLRWSSRWTCRVRWTQLIFVPLGLLGPGTRLQIF
jgi:hypothetical protein